MKVAAISPRTISFHQGNGIVTEAPLRGIPTQPAHPYREARTLHLTPREVEVLSLLCRGLSNKLISRQLNISAGTVKIHVGKILSELGVSSRLQAVVAAHRGGLLGNSALRKREQSESALEQEDRGEARQLCAA
jgi:DNA-binding NarL/FixJ family response regulator